MSVATGVSLPVSPEGTKVMVIGLSGEPSAPAAGVIGFAIGAQAAGGIVGAAVGATVGGTAVAVGCGTAVAGTAVAGTAVGGTAVGGTAVGCTAGGLVGAGAAVGVATGAQAERASMSTTTRIIRCETTFFFIFSPLIMEMKNWIAGYLH